MTDISFFSKRVQFLDSDAVILEDFGKKYVYLCNYGSTEFPRRSIKTQKAINLYEDIWLPISQIRLLAVHYANGYSFRLYIAQWLYPEKKKQIKIHEAKKYLAEIEKRKKRIHSFEAYGDHVKIQIKNQIDEIKSALQCYQITLKELWLVK